MKMKMVSKNKNPNPHWTRGTAYILACLLASSVQAEDVTQIDRYSTVVNQPTAAQMNPLLAVAEFKFPPAIQTVGDAVRMMVNDTGYTLAVADHASLIVNEVMQKPLPLTQRQLGPLMIKKMLTLLMGESVFSLLVDPVHRTISFKIKPAMATAFGVTDGK